MSMAELAQRLKELDDSLDGLQSRLGGGKGAAVRQQLEEIRSNFREFHTVHEQFSQSVIDKCQATIEESKATIKKAQDLKEAAKKKPPKPPFVFPAPKKELPGEVDPELGDRLRDQLLARFGLKPKSNGIDGLDWKDWLADHQ